ncbi:hypothetical protein HF521_016074 [Silurus meridionalis]|uniref:Ig-like domain-containing protein n=1 Tax=Silurus meridionalis TaxID=175797 RepID=A0A8T0BQE1_SILME|nr:hypothetical protein HF521_016074 [Silurus meridionalis]
MYLTVQVAPVVSVGTDVHPVSGQTEEILATCTAANSKPSAEVSWNLGTLRDSFKVHTNHTVDSEGRHTVTSNLIGTASKELNQKKVQCLVSHPGLKEKKLLEYTLNIYYPPQLVYINLTTSQGETREFQCDVDANPKPSHFNWSRISPVRETFSNVDNRLIISATPEFNGHYLCIVSNQYGDAIGSLYVNVIPATESKICWTLFIIVLIALICGFVVWKFQLNSSDPVPTDSGEEMS